MVSAATGLPLATVVDIDRRLVTAKLRTKFGRGLHAARMTPLDAARLLTAVLGSAHATAAVDTVERYALTSPDTKRSSDSWFAAAELEDLAALPDRHSFVEGLEALIGSAVSGSLARIATSSKRRAMPTIEVFAFTRATRGRIRIAALPDGRTASVEYALAPFGSKAQQVKKIRAGRKALADEAAGDLERSSRITERTIFQIAQLLRGALT